MKHLLLLFLVLVLATLACSLDFNPPPLSITPPVAEATRLPVFLLATPTFTALPPTQSPPAPTQTELPPTATEPHPLPTATSPSLALTVEQLRNVSFAIQGENQVMRTINLKDGKYQQGTDPSQPGYILVQLGEKIAFGDLDQDGLEDAALTISEEYGGTGRFVSVLAVLNQGGQPGQVSLALIEDRPVVKELAIKNGEIFVDLIVHGPADPMCCPAQPSTRFYRLVENDLVLARLTTQTPTGLDRIIQIETPANGTGISGPFVIKGSVTISPFENNLVYTVFLQGLDEPVEQAGFIISADGLGGPGTFELALDPAKYAFQGPVRIEISDHSPADGTYLAANTIFLILK